MTQPPAVRRVVVGNDAQGRSRVQWDSPAPNSRLTQKALGMFCRGPMIQESHMSLQVSDLINCNHATFTEKTRFGVLSRNMRT